MKPSEEFKPVTLEQLGLSPDEKKILVEGSQKFLPPVDTEDDTTPVDSKPESRSL